MIIIEVLINLLFRCTEITSGGNKMLQILNSRSLSKSFNCSIVTI